MDKVYTLSHAINDLSAEVEKARALHNEIMDNYFDRHNPENMTDKLFIVYEFNHYGVLSNILSDIMKRIDDITRKAVTTGKVDMELPEAQEEAPCN